MHTDISGEREREDDILNQQLLHKGILLRGPIQSDARIVFKSSYGGTQGIVVVFIIYWNSSSSSRVVTIFITNTSTSTSFIFLACFCYFTLRHQLVNPTLLLHCMYTRMLCYACMYMFQLIQMKMSRQEGRGRGSCFLEFHTQALYTSSSLFFLLILYFILIIIKFITLARNREREHVY